MDMSELENVLGGLNCQYTGCGITNGQCGGSDSGCGICNGKCNKGEDPDKRDI